MPKPSLAYDIFWNKKDIGDKIADQIATGKFEPVDAEIITKHKEFPFETKKYKIKIEFTTEVFTWN